MREAVEVLTAIALSLEQAATTAAAKAFVILDGTLLDERGMTASMASFKRYVAANLAEGAMLNKVTVQCHATDHLTQHADITGELPSRTACNPAARIEVNKPSGNYRALDGSPSRNCTKVCQAAPDRIRD